MKYDLTLGFGNKNVRAFSEGFFEKTASISLAGMPELIEIDDFRIMKDDYNKHKDIYDKYIAKCRKMRGAN